MLYTNSKETGIMAVSRSGFMCKRVKQKIEIFRMWILKYLYITAPVLGSILFGIGSKYDFFNAFYSDAESLSSIAAIAGSFIGFLLTVATVFLALPNSHYMKRLVETKHHIIFIRIITIGIVTYFITVLSWIIGSPWIRIALYSFVLGSSEVVASIYYLYYLVINNFKNFLG